MISTVHFFPFNVRLMVSSVIMCLCLIPAVSAQTHSIPLNDLSFFRDAPKSWRVAGGVTADLNKPNKLNTSRGSGILVNTSDKNNHGGDLFTVAEYGDVDIELDYMIGRDGNSGIYLQGRYEVQLEDTWGSRNFSAGNNGGIYQRWNSKTKTGYEGYAPRHNVSRAPGVWQHLKISFQAPRFDADGHKVVNAQMLRIELNGVVIHEGVSLSGPTRGAVSTAETAKGPLRIQGDHGSIAFRNITITNYENGRPEDEQSGYEDRVYPILVTVPENKVFRSFMDLEDDIRVVHAVSVGSTARVHYTYDMDYGMIVQVWRGGFLDATPMWHSRGDGSSRPVGAVQRFGQPMPMIAKLSSVRTPWKKDTTASGYVPRGYTLDVDGLPVFRYRTNGVMVTDATKVLENGNGITREIAIDKPSQDLYVRLAEGATIEEVSKGMYLVDNQSYYLTVDDAGGATPVVRESDGGKELIVPMRGRLRYTILF